MDFKKIMKVVIKVLKIFCYILFVCFILSVCLQRFSKNEISIFNYRMFTVASGSMEPKYSIGDTVKFDIDLSKINIPECNIKAVNLINRLDGSFIKLKNKEKNYDFFMNMEGMNITPSNRICEKLFACKGAKIFNTDLVYEFSLKDILVSKLDESTNKLIGTVTKVYDYTYTKFVEIEIGNQMILAEYNGQVGDQVQVKLDVDKVTIIDKQIDIIIV